jgi:FkbM family methyltransferase
MSFISYAQNFEDVMLWRALRQVEKGFYIDVGAWSPDIDSVTRAFYERGWHGINIEPNPEFHSQYLQRRIHDINLCIALGDSSGTLNMNFMSSSGLSTLDDQIAQQHERNGCRGEKKEVNVTTLKAVWDQHVPINQDVHFLKVDVEGFEAAVLRGNDWTRNRPWIVVVEATLPSSQIESHNAWESILFAANYRFAYADGLNRFYVADEHADLLPTFKYPPNVFDDFKLNAQQQAEDGTAQAIAEARGHMQWMENEWKATRERIEALAGQLALAQESNTRLAADNTRLAADNTRLAADNTRLNNELEHARRIADELNHTLRAVHASHSWRATKLPRLMSSGIRNFCKGKVTAAALWNAFKFPFKWALAGSMRFVLKRKNLRLRAIRWLNLHPELKRHLRLFARARGILPALGSNVAPIGSDKTLPTELSHLTPRARRIYTDLKMAIDLRKENG